LGDEVFRHKVSQLERLAKDEESRGIFAATYGDIDKRSKDKINQEISQGFTIQCGIKGSKLSGG
jgi:hypothetical protein